MIIWSMVERLSMNRWKGHFSRPSDLRWLSPQRSTIDPSLLEVAVQQLFAQNCHTQG